MPNTIYPETALSDDADLYITAATAWVLECRLSVQRVTEQVRRVDRAMSGTPQGITAIATTRWLFVSEEYLP